MDVVADARLDSQLAAWVMLIRDPIVNEISDVVRHPSTVRVDVPGATMIVVVTVTSPPIVVGPAGREKDVFLKAKFVFQSP